jgi:beta-galactosidase
VRGATINGRYFLQQYQAAGGAPAGTYDDGATAAVENRFGKGKALLIGTYPGAGYYRRHSPETRTFFLGLLKWAEVGQQVLSSDPDVKARLHRGPGGTYLWVVNPARAVRTVTITLAALAGAFRSARDLWQEREHPVKGNNVEVKVDDRNVAVIRLE